METLDTHKKHMAEIGKRLYNKGLVPGAAGNISIKFENTVLISPSGSCLGDLTHDDIVVIDLEGNSSEEGKIPSSEKTMHLEIYRTRSDIQAIVHAHPPKATAFAVAGVALDMPVLSEAVIVTGEIPVSEYAMPSSEKLAQIVGGYFRNHNIVLLANHGIVSGGKNLKEALYRTESAESYAEIVLGAKLLGNLNNLSPKELEDLTKLKKA